MVPEIHVIYGPPGTGKTTRLLKILQEEIAAGTPPEKIAYVSFTQEGAYQGKNRAKMALENTEEKDLRYFKTLHSLAFAELKLKRTSVMNKPHYRRFSKAMGMNFAGYYSEELKGNDDKYLFYDQLVKNNPDMASHFSDYLDMDKLAHIQKNYREYKTLYKVLDFTDMIQRFIERQTVVPVDIAIIDEAQDLTTLQWQMVWIAFSKARKVFIAGDDDQAIYEWSGADVRHFLGLHTTTTEILSQSHRLPDEILAFSKNITRHISFRANKPYTGRGPGGKVIRLGTFSEIEINSDETYMFLSRNRVFLQPVEEWLRGLGVIFTVHGRDAFSMQDYRKIVLYERYRAGKEKVTRAEAMEFMPVILDKQPNKIDKKVPWFDAFIWDQVKIDYYRDVIRTKPESLDSKIRVSTIHSVKGAEADNVILLTDISKQVMRNLEKNPDSEHRAFYVACTRAKKRLYVCDADNVHSYPLVEL